MFNFLIFKIFSWSASNKYREMETKYNMQSNVFAVAMQYIYTAINMQILKNNIKDK